jgi:hypothetical protein
LKKKESRRRKREGERERGNGFHREGEDNDDYSDGLLGIRIMMILCPSSRDLV